MNHSTRAASHASVDCTDIVRAVADREGVRPSELEPVLHESVDTDALETLLSADAERSVVSVEFEFAGYEVAVRTDGELTVGQSPSVA